MTNEWKYDVFLSFRGADTRRGFTDHLYSALVRAGIRTFRDVNDMENGERIDQACAAAIEESRFFVVVLSRRYASSAWCLDELAQIAKCRRERRSEVWPVFYDVDDPSDVEEIKGSFGKEFEQMLRRNPGVDVQRADDWKAALREVCALKGVDVQRREDGPEARNIDNIVEEILSKLDRVEFNLVCKEVGLDLRAKDVISLLASNSSSARIVGICGMAGIGNTTIAKKVYNLISHKFTRVNHLLPSSVYLQYDVKELDEDDALQLLSLHAFEKSDPPREYRTCALKVIKYAGGIPLALEILGSSLNSLSINEWNSKLEKLRVLGDQRIQEIVKVSFNALDDVEKSLFLDIACFFDGKDKDFVVSILEDCGFFPSDGINTLMKRSLLKIVLDKDRKCRDRCKLWMHDLVKDMGRNIVRRESRDPGERSRIWCHEDATEVLICQTGTKTVEGLILDKPVLSDALNIKAFKHMKRLRLLQVNCSHLCGDFKYMSKKLRWLSWCKFPLQSIPVNLDLRNLVFLDMRYSRLKKFSDDLKPMEKVKFLNLSHSKELMMTPNFKYIPSLETLILKGCTSLEEIHDSIGLLRHLVCLNLNDCTALKILPRI